MRVYDHGSEVRVTADHRDVSRFAAQWPGSGLLAGDRVSATFDASNGDLVDLELNGRLGGDIPPPLLEDMQNYAAKKLGRPELARP